MSQSQIQTPAQYKPTAPRRWLWGLRVILAFALMAALLVLLYWVGYRSYPVVAEWTEPTVSDETGDAADGSESNGTTVAERHGALFYEEAVYLRAGKLGSKNLTKSKFPQDKVLGRVRDDEAAAEPETTVSAETEAVESEETDASEETAETDETAETESTVESVIPPRGSALFTDKPHTYILYSVEKSEDYLLLLEEDGELYVYYREGSTLP